MAWSGYSEKGTGSQERGPGGFSVDVPGVVQKPDGVDFQPVRAGGNMQSNSAITVGGARPEADETFGELYKLLEPLAQKKAQEVKDRKFMEGMSRAASGVAMQEIVAEQSAFSKLFGVAPAIEGARAYTVAARKSEWAAAQQARMDELAKIDPGALPDVIQTSIASQMTGDDDTDLALQRELLSATPDLIRQHTKARYVHLQGEAKKARRGALSASIAEYNGTFEVADELKTVDQMDKAEAALIRVMTPPPGVDEDSHMDDVADMLADSLTQGKFHATRFAYDNKVVEALGPERVAKIRAAATRAAPAALSKVAPQLLDRINALATNPPGSTPAYVAEWNAINDLAAGLTGVPREYGQFISENDLVSGVIGATRAARTVGSSEQKKVAKATTESVMNAVIDKALADPSKYGQYAKDSLKAEWAGWDMTEERGGEILGAKFNSIQDPAMQARLVSTFAGTSIPAAKSGIDALWAEAHREGVDWEQGGQGYVKMLTLYSNMSDAAQERYFDADQRASLEAWTAEVNAGTPPNILFDSRTVLAKTAKRVEKSADKDSAQNAVIDAVQEQMTTSWMGMAGSPASGDESVNASLSEEELIAANSIVMSHMHRQPGNAANDKRAQWALNAAQRNGDMSIIGGRLVLNERPEEAIKNPLSAATGYSAQLSNNALEAIIKERITALGGDDSTRMVIRAPGKSPRYIVQVRNDKGQRLVAEVSAAEVKARLIAPPKKSDYEQKQYLQGRKPKLSQ